jgi:hypothetical protein
MADYDFTMTWVLDVNRPVEGLISVDTGGAWHRAKLDTLPEGKRIALELKLATITEAGALTYWDIPEGALVSLAARELKQGKATGNVLFSIPLFVDAEGTLDLWTTNLRAAIGSFPALDVRLEIVVLGEDETLRGIWTLDGRVQRYVYCETPPDVDGAVEYYSKAQTDLLFARRDGPDGYATKLVTHEGSLYWAQLVGEAWVIQKTIKVGDHYTSTLVEVA